MDFAAEHPKPASIFIKYLYRGKDHAVGRLPVLAVVVQRLEQQLRRRGRAEVQTNYLIDGIVINMLWIRSWDRIYSAARTLSATKPF